MIIPIIPGIHIAVKDAVLNGELLEMTDWHSSCGTKHCRAGWVVKLAGKAGKALETKTSTEFAAMMIYKKSSPIRVAPTKFYTSNEESLKDILLCAELEEKSQTENH